MQERIFRFGISGLVFLLAILFGYWFWGGNIGILIKENSILNEQSILSVLTIIISTPAIGFIISSINKEFWEFCIPGQKLFQLPSKKIEQDYLKIIDNEMPLNSGVKGSEEKFKISDTETVFLNQQILIRKQVENKEILAFAARRMDIVYAQINGFYSIIFGFAIGWVVSLSISNNSTHFPSYPKVLWLLPILMYLAVAFRQAKKALREANDFEKQYLINCLQNGKKQ